MAKKFGKAVLFTATLAAIAAGGMAIYNKYKASTDDFDDDFLDFDDDDDDFDDLDDFDDDDEAEDTSDTNREYVPLPKENTAKAEDSSVKVTIPEYSEDETEDNE